MKVRGQVVHQMPGRVRVRLPAHRGDNEFFSQVEQQLAASALAERVQVNPATASVLIEFSGPPDAFLASLPFELELASPAPPAALPAGAAALDPLRLVSGRDLDPMFVAGTLFGAIGLVQAVRGEIMLPALSAFWYATNAFRLARKPGAAAGGAMMEEELAED